MVDTMIRVKPYKGKYCSRRTANILNDFFGSLEKPDRDALQKEAAEFRDLIISRRAARANKIND